MAMPTATSPRNNPSHAMLHTTVHHNAKAYGATGDGIADDTSELQAMIDGAAAVAGEAFIPPGDYKTSAPLTLDSTTIRLRGSHSANPDQAGSGTRIIGNFDGPLIQRTVSASTKEFIIEDLAIHNQHATGTGVSLVGTESPAGLYRCYVRAQKGLVLGANTFQFAVQNCRFSIGGGTQVGSIGIDEPGHCFIWNCDFAGYEKGIYAKGPSTAIIGGRIETCITGLYLGHDGDNFKGSVADINFEGCTTAIYIREAGPAVISGCLLFGSGGSTYGINVDNTLGVAVLGVVGTGTFSSAFVNVPGAAQRNNLTFISCSGTPWTVTENKDLSIINCSTVTNITRTGVIATASLPAAATAEDGRLVIEDNGAGDRNLILYAGGQRFRIDGGAAI